MRLTFVTLLTDITYNFNFLCDVLLFVSHRCKSSFQEIVLYAPSLHPTPPPPHTHTHYKGSGQATSRVFNVLIWSLIS